MKSLKKTLVLLVVFSMILSAVMPAFAATDVYGLDCEEEVARLEALGVVTGFTDAEGNPTGEYRPTETITRAQMAVILCKMVGIDKVTVDENANVPSKFSDVPVGEWYTGHINVAAGKGLLSGFPDGTFRPSESLTMNQVLTLCVNALGRGEHVAQMGTWPANYIAEATKLGLLDGVKDSLANRGNVAIIVWNTLEAPAVWDVTGTEYSDGSINLSNSRASLLSIYFRDFATEEGKLKELEEVTATLVADEDHQLAIAYTSIFDEITSNITADDKEEFVENYGFEKKPSRNYDEVSYKTNDGVVVYVPAEVCEDLEDLEGKTLTILLGEDNVVVAIEVLDDITDKDFLTAYDVTDNEIVVGGTKYDLATDSSDAITATVVLNDETVTATNVVAAHCECGNTPAHTTSAGCTKWIEEVPARNALEAALAKVGVTTDLDDIEKKIEARLKIEDDEVVAIDLLASYTFDKTTEALVLEVEEGKSKYTLHLSNGEEIVVKDDAEDLPKVYVDGVKGELADIVAGNVLTIIKNSSSNNDVKLESTPIVKIYVSTKTVVGEPERVKKSNEAIEIDGEVYNRSVALNTIYVEELEEGAETVLFAADTIMDNDEVTLYLNMFGEYVAVYAEDGSSSDYQIGVVTRYYATLGSEGEDDEIDTRNIKILTADGSKASKYTLKLDTEDDKDGVGTGDNYKANNYLASMTADIEHTLVMFIADADGNIDADNFHEITNAAAGEAIADLNDYTFFATTKVATTGKKVVDETPDPDVEYRYSAAKTTIFNLGNNTVDVEVINKWDKILHASTLNTLQATATCIVDENDDLVCIALVAADAGSSDTEYAVVTEEIYTYEDDNYAKLLKENDTVTLKADENDTDLVLGAFISYKAPSDEITESTKMFDVVAFNKSLEENKAAWTGSVWAENYEVEKIWNEEKEEYEIEYVEIKSLEDGQQAELAGFVVEEDTTRVFDLRDGKCKEITMKDLMVLVEEGIYVVKVQEYNSSTKADAILIVLGDTAE